MRVNDTVIVTPIDNPGQYDPDWRNGLANALFESDDRIDPVYMRYRNDPWVKKQMAYFRAVKRNSVLTKEQVELRLASLWFRGTNVSDVRFRLEPLLLTAVSYETIAMDLLGDTQDVGAIVAYERLYFNIRDDKGRLSRSCQLRQYFALPSGEFNQDTPPEQMWKMIGSLMGYDTLVAVWLWKDAHGIKDKSQEYLLDEMWRLAQSRLFMSMFADRVGHESMAKLLGAISGQQKLLKEGNSSGQTEINMVQSMQQMLMLVSPTVIDATAKGVDEAQLKEEATASRLRAQSAVDEVVLDETGKNGVRLIAEGES